MASMISSGGSRGWKECLRLFSFFYRRKRFNEFVGVVLREHIYHVQIRHRVQIWKLSIKTTRCSSMGWCWCLRLFFKVFML
jgi:hypothetical protein